ncbi:MAG: ATP-grasp domain-containing protein [Promethearchaeota archaeon]
MRKKIIFIFEFVSGGGFNLEKIPISLFCEGFGMLRSIIADFKELDFEICTILDYRIFFLSSFLQADVVKIVEKHDEYIKLFKEMVNKSNYSFIIAPEFSKILYNLTKIVKDYNRILLSVDLKAIDLCTSKFETYKFFKKNKVNTPLTYQIPFKGKSLDFNFIFQKFEELNCPIIIKPDDGVGAENIFHFEKDSQFFNSLTNINTHLDKNRSYILQEFIEGKDLSVSLIGVLNSEESPILLSINSQDINLKDLIPEYLGGYTPLSNYEELMEKLSSILRKISNLKIGGYFGIDFIEQNNGLLNFIEINPRLTTSYIGLRNTINLNCAELILNSKLNFLRIPEVKFLNHSAFTRIDFYSNEHQSIERFYEFLMPKLIKLIPELVTPPIALDNSNLYSSFIATKTKDLNSSKIRMSKILESLKSLNLRVIRPIQKELL